MNNTIGSSVQYNSQSHISFFSLLFFMNGQNKEKNTLNLKTTQACTGNQQQHIPCFRAKHSNQLIQKPKPSSNCPKQNKQLEQKRGTKQLVVEPKHSTIPSISPRTK
jgi:hypothetical protein